MRMILALPLMALASCSKQSPGVEELKKLVQASIQSKDYPAARGHLDALVQLTPGDFDNLVTRGGVAIFVGDTQQATADFNAASAIDKRRAEKARFFFADRATWAARELDMGKRYKEALAIYDCLLDLYPQSGMSYHERGGLKSEMGNHQAAIADLTKAIEFNGGHNRYGDSYLLRAHAKRAIGDLKGADEDEAKANASAKMSDSK